MKPVEKTAQELIDSDHFAANDMMIQLRREWRELKLLAGKRTKKLDYALEAQKVGFHIQSKNSLKSILDTLHMITIFMHVYYDT